MAHPYQIVRTCKVSESTGSGFLLAACGPKIISVKVQDGSVISQWPLEDDSSDITTQHTDDNEGPPGKKRKVEKASDASPTIIKLVVSPDQHYAVAVTGEDKCIRVFAVAENGTLEELSQRCMPKRPCAILVTPDNQDILCGDKFGDVYSLPLLLEPSDTEMIIDEAPKEDGEATPAKAYVPTASNLTVHTARNRRALENQRKQKDLRAKSKEPLKFKHQLLLGHVSMLTDVQYATQVLNGQQRNHIITADRDEHIRVSRAAPQAHIIERYCLGHTEFISKLCLMPESDVLVSGGGDDWLGIWNWVTGELLGKCDIKTALQRFLKPSDQDESANNNIAVSGLWAVPKSSDRQAVLLAASEKIPAIAVIPMATLNSTSPVATAVELPGNALDVTVVGSTIIVSLDPSETSGTRLQAYNIHIDGDQPLLMADDEISARLQAVNKMDAPFIPEAHVLYGVEQMRKRGNDETQEAS
ncbi:hypothetical protein AAFC00_001768 [Neodothiora populina]|uniref:Transfer RNA methyltransferase 82 n=1 Tax=Neodothiora populina TaxID=2781224 RepID=A0ABR3PQ32_9PEZI